MTDRPQPFDPAYMPKRFKAPDFGEDGVVQTLIIHDETIMHLIWQEPDRVMILPKVQRGHKYIDLVENLQAELRRMAEDGVKPRKAHALISEMLPANIAVGPLKSFS